VKARQVGSHRRLPDERDLLRRQQTEVGTPLVLILKRSPRLVVVFSGADGVQSQGVEPVVLTDMPALLLPPRRPLHDLLHPISVVPSPGIRIGRRAPAHHSQQRD
jgi:hypothetical protein